MTFIPALMTNAMTSDFLSSISPGYVQFDGIIYQQMVPPSYGVYVSQLVGLPGAVHILVVLDFYSKNLQITSKLLTQRYIYHKLRKNMWKVTRSHSELLSKFGEISCKEYVSEGITHPVFYGDIHVVYKLRRVKGSVNFVSTGSKIDNMTQWSSRGR